MDGDRKYRQAGYHDSDRGAGAFKTDKQRPSGPKLPLDVTGPKLPRLVQNVVAARCFSCAFTLPAGMDFTGSCPKCATALHCCKQCVHFDSSTRFQCVKPITLRIPLKDRANECALFSPAFTVARDGVATGQPNSSGPSSSRQVDYSARQAPRNANDARAAFDSLFKK